MLTIFGNSAVAVMLARYALEARSPWFAFGLACFGASAYGWLAGAWPFGVIEGLWGVLALRRWQRARATDGASSDEKRRQERTSEIKSLALTDS
jgi:hypothetical protein